MSLSWDRARSDSENSLSAVDCTWVRAFLKDVGDGKDFGVGFRKMFSCGSTDVVVLRSEVAKQWRFGGWSPP